MLLLQSEGVRAQVPELRGAGMITKDDSDEVKFTELERYRFELFMSCESMSECRALFMKKAKELFPGRDVRYDAKTGNVAVAEFDSTEEEKDKKPK